MSNIKKIACSTITILFPCLCYEVFVFLSRRFVDKYMELKSRDELSEAALFEETGKALLAEGITLKRRGAPPVRVLA